MAKYYMSSDGSYSAYCVGGLYVGDDNIPEDAWQQHCKGWEKVYTTSLKECQINWLTRVNPDSAKLYADEPCCISEHNAQWRHSKERKEFVAAMGDKFGAFVDKWKLTQVEYQECHECD